MRIVELAADSPLLPAAVALLWQAEAETVRGDCNPWSAAEVAATWDTSTYRRWIGVALVDERLVGAVSAQIYRDGNAHLAEVEIGVTLDHRRRGIGRQLWQRAVGAVAALGADTVLLSVGAPITAVDAWQRYTAALSDPDLTLRSPVANPAGMGFARDAGAEQVQTEIYSRLDLPADPAAVEAMLAPLDAQVTAHAGDYVVTTHRGLPPEQLLLGLARLNSRMTIDAPSGQVDLRPDDYGEARLRADAAVNERAGRVVLWTVAVERRSGDVAALSSLGFRSDEPAWAEQWDTIVDPPHRGHRLGFAVKSANLRRLLAEHPAVRHVSTYNALENGPMLAVNRAMGFEPVSVIAICQRVI